MQQMHRRNRLTPWYIGLAIIIAAVGYVAYYISTLAAAGVDLPSPYVTLMVLVVMPIVYLVLMYLTFISEK